MSVYTPAFFGLILRRNERTRRFMEREIELLSKRFPDVRAHLNEDEHLIGFSVAMNGRDLQSAIEDLEKENAVYGTDFVATSSDDGVLGEAPDWLTVKVGRLVAAPEQLTKLYSLAVGSETSQGDA